MRIPVSDSLTGRVRIRRYAKDFFRGKQLQICTDICVAEPFPDARDSQEMWFRYPIRQNAIGFGNKYEPLPQTGGVSSVAQSIKRAVVDFLKPAPLAAAAAVYCGTFIVQTVQIFAGRPQAWEEKRL
jgi:hypothetical protein